MDLAVFKNYRLFVRQSLCSNKVAVWLLSRNPCDWWNSIVTWLESLKQEKYIFADIIKKPKLFRAAGLAVYRYLLHSSERVKSGNQSQLNTNTGPTFQKVDLKYANQ